MKRALVLLSLLLLLIVPALPMRAGMDKVVVISNSVDRPAALELVTYLMKGGISASISGPSEFSSLMKSGDVKEIIVLGGPDAYQGVGNITSELMSKIDQSYLRGNKGAAVIRRYGFFVGGKFKDVIVIAGSTRKETRLCAELYASLGFPGSLVYPEVVGRIISMSSKRSLVYVRKYIKGGEVNRTVIQVSYFSGDVNGSPGRGYVWSYEVQVSNYTAQVSNYNVFLENGKYCYQSAVEFNKSEEHTGWKCSLASMARIKEVYGGIESVSSMLSGFLKVENKTVPAGTFRCLVEETAGFKVWLSPEVPFTGVVAASLKSGSAKVLFELTAIKG